MTKQPSDDASASAPQAFSQVSSVRARSAGTFDAEINSAWTIAGRPNGGYLLALLGRAAASLADSAHVVAASAHYLRSPVPGSVVIEAELLRRGRSISQVRARLTQDGRPCVEALLSTAELDSGAAPRWDVGVPGAQHVPFDDGVRVGSVSPHGFTAPIMDQVDLRLDPESSGLTNGGPSGRGQLRGWLKLLVEERFDPVSLLYAVDAFPPATYDTDFGGMVSTIELTAYIRAIPGPGPVRIMTRARLIDPQCVDQTCDIWDGTGRLVAQATQLAKVLG